MQRMACIVDVEMLIGRHLSVRNDHQAVNIHKPCMHAAYNRMIVIMNISVIACNCLLHCDMYCRAFLTIGAALTPSTHARAYGGYCQARSKRVPAYSLKHTAEQCGRL